MAAAVLLAPGEAQALNECGALASGAATCSDQAYANGIQYNVNTGWEGGVAGDVALTVTGGPATTITARPHNVLHWERGAIIIRTAPQGSGDATTRNIALRVGDGGGAVAIRNRSGADSNGVNIHQHGKAADGTTVTLGSGVTIGTESAPMSNGGVEVYVTETGNSGDHSITSAATIHSTGNGLEMAAVGPGDFAVTNTGSITVAATGGRAVDKNGILSWHWEHGSSGRVGGTRRTVDSTTTITNAGSISVAAGQGIGIDAMGHGLGLYRIVNSGGGAQGITASGANGRGIYLDASHHTGAAGSRAIEVENSGRITTSVGNGRGIWVQTTGARDGELQAGQHKGDVAIANSGSISSASHAVFVDADMGAVSVTHSGGSITSSAADGIRVQQAGTGDAVIAVSSGATLTSKRTGIHADLSHADNADGQVKVTQGGTVTGRTGVLAAVSRASTVTIAAGVTTDEMRAADDPLIEITWTGTFTQAETGNAAGGSGGPIAAGSGGPIAAHEEVPEAETAMATRYGTAAGIEAHALSWRDVAEKVAEGDDPGAFADAAAVTALFAADADADMKTRAEAAIASFRAQLTSDRGAIPDVDSVDADSNDEVTDAEITSYLSMDDDDRRTFLRNILKEHLSEAETAVLRAVVTNTGLGAALDAGGAIFSDDYKSAVRALLDKYNVGNIRVAMTGGSIDSRGDGIRAYYATPNDKNGRIDVTIGASAINVAIAAGTTVSGGAAGVYVANAGMGTVMENSDWGRLLNLNEDVTLRQQFVAVRNGMVTGGTDAAVHLVGGGALLVGEMGKLVAGSSGRAIRVNEPGRSEIVINGEVRGGSGMTAAVETDGGGRITLGRTGRVVLADGAPNAIRAKGAAGSTEVTLVVDSGTVYREDAGAAVERLGGAIVGGAIGDKPVRFAVTDEDGMTGMRTDPVGLDKDGRPDTSGFDPRPEEEEEEEEEEEKREMDDGDESPKMSMACGMASDDRCRLYEALPSALLAMNDLPTYAERMSAARDGKGGWAQVEAAGGKWKADSSTRSDMAYDHRRYGVRAGMDFTAGEAGRVGVSVHGLRGSAEMTRSGGEVELSGGGLGVNATAAMAGDVHVDAQAAVTWYDVDVESARRSLKKGAEGMGYALGVEVGRSMTVRDGVSVTPRGGLLWSKVSLDDFTDTRGDDGTRVSVKDADSLVGRVGLMVDTAVGSEDAPGRVFGSVDVEHEFKDETSVDVAGASLETTARSSGVRFGLGGEFTMREDVVLRLRADYTTMGGGTNEYGGGVELNLRF